MFSLDGLLIASNTLQACLKEIESLPQTHCKPTGLAGGGDGERPYDEQHGERATAACA